MTTRRKEAPASLLEGYEVLQVPADGDCFFSAVIAAEGLETTVSELRDRAYTVALSAKYTNADEDLKLAVQFGKPEVSILSCTVLLLLSR